MGGDMAQQFDHRHAWPEDGLGVVPKIRALFTPGDELQLGVPDNEPFVGRLENRFGEL